eukprot:Gb_00691 [translate_table: standard]
MPCIRTVDRFVKADVIDQVEEIYCLMEERGSIMDVMICSTLMSSLCKNGRIYDALVLLAKMLDRGIPNKWRT